MKLAKILGAALLCPAFWMGAAEACSLELDTPYTITPFVDDGLSRAERTSCALGNLSYYDLQQGWRDMRGADGRPLQASDMAGVIAPPGELLVAILRDGSVAMRWGGPGDGNFFSKDHLREGFYAKDGNGAIMTALRIGEVSFNPNSGLITVGLRTNSAEYCEITSDQTFTLSWGNWSCIPMPGTQTAAPNPTGGALQVPVPVGGEPDGDACAAYGVVIGGRASVRAGPGAGYPVIDSIPVGTGVAMCEAHPDGAWEGIVYPNANEDCGVGSPLSRQPYSGPCKSGWIDIRNLNLIAG